MKILKKFILGITLIATSNLLFAQDIKYENLNRGEDQTYLTLPEWFLVHSPEEYANYLGKGKSPSHFPFWGHIEQFWETYKGSYDVTKDKYPFNTEYHVMVMTIGVSTTIEYIVKGIYESFAGKFTEMFDDNTQEDRYAAKIAKEYVDFIKIEPWYKFDFNKALKGLWSESDLFSGGNIIRKIERRYALSTEYLIKSGYAYIIKKATAASFTPPIPYSSVLIKGNYENYDNNIVNLGMNGENNMLRLPRYGEFTPNLIKVANSNKDFVEIAGNNSNITIAVLVDKNFDERQYPYKIFILQPILTEESTKRVVYEVPIKDLASMLRNLSSKNIKIEHIYDF